MDEPTVKEADGPGSRSRRSRRPVWPIVVGASTIVGLLAGGLIALNAHDTALPDPPVDLAGAARTCVPPRCEAIVSSVTLRWAPADDPSVTGFEVIRDGVAIPDASHLPAGTTEFVDHNVAPGQQHAYVVRATGHDGNSSPSKAVQAQLPLPPVRTGQLRGVYEVTLVVRGATNIASLSGIVHPVRGDRRATTWGFQPTCEPTQGACPTRWMGRSGLLTPRAGVWSGTLSGPEAQCPDRTRAPSPIRLVLDTRDAALIGGTWSVVSFTGTYSVRFHCPGFRVSRGSVDVTGSRH